VELRDPDAASPPADLLREVFGFTPAEASVAAALSCGRALPDIARQLGVGQSTVKSQLKSIMAKTQTRRQAELVALLHASLGRLGGLFPRLGDEGAAGRA
jgi:DNA-binding CsgD family transcriptional regulator